MNSNMAVRHYLTSNADQIIKNKQLAAVGNCAAIISIVDKKPIAKTPILFSSINDLPLFQDISDLKMNFLNYYKTIVGMFSPGISY